MSVNVGQLIYDTSIRKDAIHVAIIPVVAYENLNPGQAINFRDTAEEYGYVKRSTNPIGVVDPFLTTGLSKDEKFYMFLFPETINDLRHDWDFSLFDTDEDPDGIGCGTTCG